MKKFGKFMGSYLAILLLAMMCIIGCKNAPWDRGLNNYDTADSTYFAQQLEAVANPDFLSVEDAVGFKVSQLEADSIKNLFLSIPTQQLQNVCKVLVKKKGIFNMKDVISEYRASKQIYDTVTTPLPVQTTKKVDTTATDLGSRRVLSTSYSMRTDTIDGKPVKIMIKTEEYVE